MQCAKLTDDELWYAITQNTDELSAILRHLDADVRIGIAGTRCARSRSYSEAVNKFECEYREYIAELRRRHHCPEKSVGLNRGRKWFRIDPRSIKTILARLVRGVTPATFVQYSLVAALISVIIVGALSLRVH
jgi:hypothetical protein